jgi:hypothetical protein
MQAPMTIKAQYLQIGEIIIVGITVPMMDGYGKGNVWV